MKIDRSSLVRLIGFPATLIHGDTLTTDRWLWLKKRLPETRGNEKLLDVGSASGAYSIGAALRGYKVLGLDWDERGQQAAIERAAICNARTASFDAFDVRALGERTDLYGDFDVVVCCETIEHILDDRKLMQDIATCLKPGGRLLLTTPYLYFRPISAGSEKGPYLHVEDGGHVRRGYTSAMLEELCSHAGLISEDITYCSGLLSQKATTIWRKLSSSVHPLLGWGATLPLRPVPLALDRVATPLLNWPRYSICLEAYKPRWKHERPREKEQIETDE